MERDGQASAVRSVKFADRQANTHLNPPAGNSITTARYTTLNFLPLFLFEQFNPALNFANFYFLIVCIFQAIPSVSTTGGKPTTAMPLTSVLVVQALLLLRENMQKTRDDAEANSSPTALLRGGKFSPGTWAELLVGDVVLVKKKEIIPADMVLLSCAPLNYVYCHVNTKSLDGETDNKLRKALKCVDQKMRGEGLVKDDDAAKPPTAEEWKAVVGPFLERTLAGAEVECEKPNNKTSGFTGTAKFTDGTSQGLGIENVMLRGCKLVDAEWAIGLVINVGTNCKVNFVDESKAKPKPKKASIKAVINQQIQRMVGILVLLCIIGCIAQAVWIGNNGGAWYLGLAGNPKPAPSAGANFLKLFAFFLLLYQFVPISLYVTMAMLHTGQSYFMVQDLEMHDAVEKEDLKVRTMELNDELGMVTHIFSDKTGTLTQNLMQFRKLALDGVVYGVGNTEIGLARMRMEGQDVRKLAKEMEKDNCKIRRGIDRYTNFKDGNGPVGAAADDDDAEAPSLHGLVDDPASPNHDAEIARKTQLIALNMALNHTITVERDDDGNVTDLSGSSPDEKALLAGAWVELGVKFVSRNQRTGEVVLEQGGKRRTVLVLRILKYTSSRKRMSVIVKFLDTKKVFLFVKGADSIIFDRLKRDADGKLIGLEQRERLRDVLNSWELDALRGLCFAYKEVNEDEFEAWDEKYSRAMGSPAEQEKRRNKQPNLITQLTDEMESGWTLQGATACEDKLQIFVPRCLANLRRAGISIWMITGDRVGTAMNIASACQLLLPESQMRWICITQPHTVAHFVDTAEAEGVDPPGERMTDLRLADLEEAQRGLSTSDDVKSDRSKLEALEKRFPGLLHQRGILEREAGRVKRGELGDLPLALIIDEKAIDYFLAEPDTYAKLLLLANACKCVVGSRARKDQKAKLVGLIKDNDPSCVSLAIGDGANDVDMIKRAHIGVGIIGKEGMQAVNNSDYSISKFYFLQRLLLVHGHFNSLRVGTMVPYMFYKNVIASFSQYLWQFSNGFSGALMYPDLVGVQWYNTIYTAMPIVILGIMDRHVSPESAMKYPQLFGRSMHRRYFSAKLFWQNQLEACCLACCVYFIPHWSFGINGIGNGETWTYAEHGAMQWTLVIVLANLRVWMMINRFHWIFYFFWFGTGPVLWAIACAIWSEADLNFKDQFFFLGTMPTLFAEPKFWLVSFLLVLIAIARPTFYKAYLRAVKPELHHLVQEIELLGADPRPLERVLLGDDYEGDDDEDGSDSSKAGAAKVTPAPTVGMSVELVVKSKRAATKLKKHHSAPSKRRKILESIRINDDAHDAVAELYSARGRTLTQWFHGEQKQKEGGGEAEQKTASEEMNMSSDDAGTAAQKETKTKATPSASIHPAPVVAAVEVAAVEVAAVEVAAVVAEAEVEVEQDEEQ